MSNESGLLTHEQLDDLMIKIGLKDFRNSVKESNERRGRKPKDYYNHYFHVFADLSYGAHKNDLASWVDDILVGAGRLDTGNTKVSPDLIFAILKGMPYLSTAEIKSWLNRKRVVIGGDEITSDRYCRHLMNICLSAMRSLDYHTERGHKIQRYRDSDQPAFSYKTDMKRWIEEKQKLDSNNSYPQTEEELISKLKTAGMDDSQIEKYLADRK
ncbi:hypothetical protein ABE356_000217 [Escherichia coli]|nr:hypothetical protein [Escherichia coli]